MKTAFQGALCAALLAAAGCRPAQKAVVPEKVRFGLALETPCVLPMVALEKGYFAEEELAVEVTDFVSGARAMSAMLTGAVDVATVAEVPVAAASFERRDFRVFASIASAVNQHWIVARKDSGIAKPADLRGKHLATQKMSSIHFFLHLFLVRHGMSENDVWLSFVKIEELVPALVKGQVDAISIREPYRTEATRQLGGKALVFELHGAYVRRQYLVASATWLRDQPEAARRLVRGLLRAERFVQAHPEEALRLVAARVKMPPELLAKEWGQIYPGVTLEQALLPQLEDEAKWMLDQRLVPARPIPNYLEWLDVSVLEAVRPEAVTVVR